MSVEKISLTSFRILLFFFFAGVGCFLPFISLHLKSSGLSIDEIRIISFVSPLFATLGPVTIGPLVDYLSIRKKNNVVKKSTAKSDRNTYIRTVLSITVLLSSVFYCLLLSVPTIPNPNPNDQEAVFVCNEQGASLLQDKCNDLKCSSFPQGKSGTAELSKCRFNCQYPDHYGHIETNENADIERKDVGIPAATTSGYKTTKRTTPSPPRPLSVRPEIDISNLDDFFGNEPDYDDDFGSGDESDFDWNKHNRQKREEKEDSGLSLEESPHICHEKLTGNKSSRTCFVFTPISAAVNVTATLKSFHQDEDHCAYPLGGNFSCRIPRGIEKPNESCKVICDVKKIFPADNFHILSQCDKSLSDPVVTFWSYLAFRSFGDFFFTASIGLLLGATLVAAGDEAGREVILPTLSYGLLSVVMGYLHSDDMTPLQLENIPNFFLGIVGYGFFSVLALFVLIFATDLSMGPPDWWKTTRNVQIIHKAEFYSVLIVLMFAGILWGPIYFHVPWHVNELGGLELYVGCAAAMGALISLPIAWKAYKIVDYCGYSNALIGAFTIYILRYTGLFFIDNPWVLVAVGGFEALTLCLMLFAAIFYIRNLVPKHLTFTSQSLAVAAHFCLGSGLGCLITTLLSPNNANNVEVPIQEEEGKTFESEAEIEDSSFFEFKGPYHLIYCVGAIFSAVIAVVYFALYHCCLKKRCLAPLYRSEQNGTLPRDSGENGLYTPLRVIRNGGQSQSGETNT